MADAVTAVQEFAGSKSAIYHFTNVSDGTGETAVQKINLALLPGAPAQCRINRIWATVSGMAVKILFNHTTPDVGVVLGDGTTHLDYSTFGGLKDPASAGGNGNILFTTIGAVANDTYDIVLEVTYP